MTGSDLRDISSALRPKVGAIFRRFSSTCSTSVEESSADCLQDDLAVAVVAGAAAAPESPAQTDTGTIRKEWNEALKYELLI